MKKVSTIFLVLISVNCLAQDKSDLYLRIDSMINHDLAYTYDETTDQLPKYQWDSTKNMMPSFSTLPANPAPLILMDGQIINSMDLNKYKLSQIATIDCFKKDDMNMLAIYGSASKNGAIILQTKKFQRNNR